MRDAHVRVALAQQILRAQQDVGTYHEQMRALQQVVKNMEETRDEVKVSGRLSDDADRRLIAFAYFKDSESTITGLWETTPPG